MGTLMAVNNTIMYVGGTHSQIGMFSYEVSIGPGGCGPIHTRYGNIHVI